MMPDDGYVEIVALVGRVERKLLDWETDGSHPEALAEMRATMAGPTTTARTEPQPAGLISPQVFVNLQVQRMGITYLDDAHGMAIVRWIEHETRYWSRRQVRWGRVKAGTRTPARRWHRNTEPALYLRTQQGWKPLILGDTAMRDPVGWYYPVVPEVLVTAYRSEVMS